jgi:DNA-binding NtrC family response regulator
VEVESAAGQGSSFHAFLPAMHKPASVEASPDGRAELPRGNETILVVEDEVSVRRLTALSLRTLGYAVLEASTSMEALEVWKKDSQCIQLLLTDIIMPGQMSGLELAEKLLAQKPALRVICSTGYRRESTPATSFPSPNITFLPKPYRFDKLAVLVRRWLDQESAS